MKFKKHDKIYINQWLELKPYNNQVPTDAYYINVANKILKVLNHKDASVLKQYFHQEEIVILACVLASYFEDIISGTNIWNSFVNYHSRLYNKKVPFYSTDSYYDNEINEEDVAFLIWYFLNTIQEKGFIGPYNDHIITITSMIMDVLEEEWEYAPENEHIKSYYTIDRKETDYYRVRFFIDIILTKTYLFYTDTAIKLYETEEELIRESNENTQMYLQENRVDFIHNTRTQLLALKGSEWAAEILGNSHPISKDLLSLSPRIRGYFLYKGQNEKDIFIEHIASGKKFNLTKESFDHYHTLKEIDTILFLGIVKWQNEWWFSGVSSQMPFDPDLVLDEKNSIESRMQTNFIDHNEVDVASMLKSQLDAFLEFNNGEPIAFMESSKLDGFYKEYFNYFNNSLNLSPKEREDAKKRMRKEGFFGDNTKQDVDFDDYSETGLFFFNPRGGGELAFGVNSAFPTKNNPYFNPENSEEDIMYLMLSEEISKELVYYCIDNYKDSLPFFKEGLGKIYLNDIDFILRFSKKENYHTKPQITLTGMQE